MDMKMIKIIGYASTAVGVATTVVTSWVDEKKMESTITEKVAEAIAQKYN